MMPLLSFMQEIGEVTNTQALELHSHEMLIQIRGHWNPKMTSIMEDWRHIINLQAKE